jgi:hypothetical protein
MKRDIKDLTGIRLLVIELHSSGYKEPTVWRCKCDCGNNCYVATGSLCRKRTPAISCGCHRKIDPNRESKRCIRCKLILPVHNFFIDKNSADLHTYYCKPCTKIITSESRDKINRRNRMRRSNEVELRIVGSLRSRVGALLRGKNKSISTLELVGCSSNELKEYLNPMLDENMSWDNYGSYWQLDHIRPCSSFDLTQESEQRKCFHYSNLQPLEKTANIRKGDKWDG